jgi:hypothetical protein
VAVQPQFGGVGFEDGSPGRVQFEGRDGVAGRVEDAAEAEPVLEVVEEAAAPEEGRQVAAGRVDAVGEVQRHATARRGPGVPLDCRTARERRLEPLALVRSGRGIAEGRLAAVGEQPSGLDASTLVVERSDGVPVARRERFGDRGLGGRRQWFATYRFGGGRVGRGRQQSRPADGLRELPSRDARSA